VWGENLVDHLPNDHLKRCELHRRDHRDRRDLNFSLQYDHQSDRMKDVMGDLRDVMGDLRDVMGDHSKVGHF
jgi:hypothetical protein